MNIQDPDQCADAWQRELHAVQNDPLIPESDRDRVIQAVDDEFAPVCDAVTAYFSARFMTVC